MVQRFLVWTCWCFRLFFHCPYTKYHFSLDYIASPFVSIRRCRWFFPLTQTCARFTLLRRRLRLSSSTTVCQSYFLLVFRCSFACSRLPYVDYFVFSIHSANVPFVVVSLLRPTLLPFDFTIFFLELSECVCVFSPFLQMLLPYTSIHAYAVARCKNVPKSNRKMSSFQHRNGGFFPSNRFSFFAVRK